MLQKETSRYRMNKFLSDMPISTILFQADFTQDNVPEITEHLNRLTSETSLTLIVVKNHTPKAYFQKEPKMTIISFAQYLKHIEAQQPAEDAEPNETPESDEPDDA